MSNSSIDRTQLGAITPSQSGPRSNGNEEVLRIPQSSSCTRASPSGCLMSYLGHSLRESYSSAEMQSVYSAAPSWLGYWERGIHFTPLTIKRHLQRFHFYCQVSAYKQYFTQKYLPNLTVTRRIWHKVNF